MLEEMVAKFVIVACEQDLCSRNIGKKLEESFEPFELEGCPYKTFRKDDTVLVWHKNELVLDVTDLDQYFSPEVYIFVFRHLGKGNPRLTVHPCGNFILPKPDSKAPYRGEPHRIALSHPAYMKLALRKLNLINIERNLGYEVSYEVTHHTPTELKAPVMFVEVGDTEEHHKDQRAIQAAADAVLHVISTKPEKYDNCLAIGGDHYTQRFTKRALTENYAFGHFIASHAIADVTQGVVELALDKIVGGVRYAMLDQKQQGSQEDRKRILDVLEKRGVEVIKLPK